MNKLNKKGFTLVELLAVIVVLALLMVVAGSSIGNALKNSKVKTLQTEAQKIVNKINEEAQVSLMLHNEITSDAFSDADFHTFESLDEAVDSATDGEGVKAFTFDSTKPAEGFKHNHFANEDSILVQVRDGDYIVWLVLTSNSKDYKIRELCIEGSDIILAMAQNLPTKADEDQKSILKGNTIDFSWPIKENDKNTVSHYISNKKEIKIYVGGTKYICGIGRTDGKLIIVPDNYEYTKQKGNNIGHYSKNNLEILEVGK